MSRAQRNARPMAFVWQARLGATATQTHWHPHTHTYITVFLNFPIFLFQSRRTCSSFYGFPRINHGSTDLAGRRCTQRNATRKSRAPCVCGVCLLIIIMIIRISLYLSLSLYLRHAVYAPGSFGLWILFTLFRFQAVQATTFHTPTESAPVTWLRRQGQYVLSCIFPFFPGFSLNTGSLFHHLFCFAFYYVATDCGFYAALYSFHSWFCYSFRFFSHLFPSHGEYLWFGSWFLGWLVVFLCFSSPSIRFSLLGWPDHVPSSGAPTGCRCRAELLNLFLCPINLPLFPFIVWSSSLAIKKWCAWWRFWRL